MADIFCDFIGDFDFLSVFSVGEIFNKISVVLIGGFGIILMDFISTCAVGIATEFFEKSSHFFCKNICDIFRITDCERTETYAEFCNSCENTLENMIPVETPYGFAGFKAVAVIEVG